MEGGTASGAFRELNPARRLMGDELGTKGIAGKIRRAGRPVYFARWRHASDTERLARRSKQSAGQMTDDTLITLYAVGTSFAIGALMYRVARAWRHTRD